jgi:AraC-like DNA-binding protein
MIDLPIKPFYSLSELARVCGVQRRTLRKLFHREGIELLGSGKLAFVSLSEIERKLPTLFEGIRAAHHLLDGLG